MTDEADVGWPGAATTDVSLGVGTTVGWAGDEAGVLGAVGVVALCGSTTGVVATGPASSGAVDVGEGGEGLASVGVAEGDAGAAGASDPGF